MVMAGGRKKVGRMGIELETVRPLAENLYATLSLPAGYSQEGRLCALVIIIHRLACDFSFANHMSVLI